MTPKEKAKDLVTHFYSEVQWKLGQEDCLDRAKRCALIAVDEVLKILEHSIPEKHTIYWQEVKKEIELL